MMNREDTQKIQALEKRLRELERKTSGIPVKFAKGGTGTGNFVLHVLDYFPAIPTEGTEFLLHTHYNQLFHAHETYTEWRPLENWFAGSGEPTWDDTTGGGV